MTAASALAHGAVICAAAFWPRGAGPQVQAPRLDFTVRPPTIRANARPLAGPAPSARPAGPASPARRTLRWKEPAAVAEPAPWLGAPIDAAAAAPAPGLQIMIGAVQSADGLDGVETPPPAPLPFDASRMTPPRLLSGPDPAYTEEALEREVEGAMRVACVVTASGGVRGCRVLQGLPFMDRAVVEALERRRYAPAQLDGRPVETDFIFVVRLRLPR